MKNNRKIPRERLSCRGVIRAYPRPSCEEYGDWYPRRIHPSLWDITREEKTSHRAQETRQRSRENMDSDRWGPRVRGDRMASLYGSLTGSNECGSYCIPWDHQDGYRACDRDTSQDLPRSRECTTISPNSRSYRGIWGFASSLEKSPTRPLCRSSSVCCRQDPGGERTWDSSVCSRRIMENSCEDMRWHSDDDRTE